MEKLKHLFQREFDPQETHFYLRIPANIYWSWGVSQITFIDKLGLLLKVNGHHHKDFVLITLGWEDLFIITLLDSEKNIIKSISGVYVDQLQTRIDKEIEFINSYK